jgi:hypothetical protein
MRSTLLRGAPGVTMALAVLPAVLGAGCGDLSADVDDPVAVTEHSVLGCTAPSCKKFTDATGTISIRVRACGWVTATGTNGRRTAVATCGVDTDAGYALVGGGAEIENSPSPGALLKSSIPDPSTSFQVPAPGGDTTTTAFANWVARSAEYGATNSTAHRLRAYSIGLKLVGLSAEETAGNMTWSDGSSGDGSPHVQHAQVGDLFIGGGATVLPYDANLYLRNSEPDTYNNGWYVAIGNNGDGATGDAKSYVGSIKPCPLRANLTTWGCLTASSSATMGGGSGGYISTTLTESGTANMVTAIGGHGYSYPEQTVKRFITDLIPGMSTQGTTIVSKNTATSAAGGNIPWLLSIAKN